MHVGTMSGAANAAGSLPVSAPEQARDRYGPLKGAGLYGKLGACRPSAEDSVAGPLLASLRALARTWLGLDEAAGRPESAMHRLIEANAPAPPLQVKVLQRHRRRRGARDRRGRQPRAHPERSEARFDPRRISHSRPQRKDRRARARPRRERAGEQGDPHDRRKQDARGRGNARPHGEAQVRRQDEARGHALPEEIHSQEGLLGVAAPHEVEVRPGRGSCGDEKIARPDPAADCPGARSAECEVERN